MSKTIYIFKKKQKRAKNKKNQKRVKKNFKKS